MTKVWMPRLLVVWLGSPPNSLEIDVLLLGVLGRAHDAPRAQLAVSGVQRRALGVKGSRAYVNHVTIQPLRSTAHPCKNFAVPAYEEAQRSFLAQGYKLDTSLSFGL